jgi:hypothetical protein
MDLPPDALRGMVDSIASLNPDDMERMLSMMETARAADGLPGFGATLQPPMQDSQQLQQAAASLQVCALLKCLWQCCCSLAKHMWCALHSWNDLE